MPFKKGVVSNPAGRPKGTISEKRKQWEKLEGKLTGKHTKHIVEYLDMLWRTDKDKFFVAYTQLLQYFKPKIAQANIEVDAEIIVKSIPSWFGEDMVLIEDQETKLIDEPKAD